MADKIEQVSFISTETGDDLIVSFAVIASGFGDIKSLILLRTPKYEFFLDDAERGVSVSYDDFPEDEDDYLQGVEIADTIICITTDRRRYTLDVGRIEKDELKEMREMLEMMNFDNRFKIRVS
jgi:hypothetical protein